MTEISFETVVEAISIFPTMKILVGFLVSFLSILYQISPLLMVPAIWFILDFIE